MPKLCNNPTCSSHCEVEYRKITTSGEMAWCFANGFQMPLTKDQLAHFHPESKINVCSKCRWCYDYMLDRAREIANRMVSM